MSFDVSNNLNSAIVSGVLGVRNASDGITQSSIGLAQQAAKLRDPKELLSDVALQQVGLSSKLLPTRGDSMTSNLLSLSINLNNAQASTKVLDVANETVGRLIDEIA
ncbi:hypothetical protein KIH87_00475 [Paraneptunicella aestuarii]|uniref:hypothetical protein n=1 Tax=Paraneptunicella aestuarii TaxID=2831148 RepID=UPI001E445EEF|nr:hypothetical protein [Paraneptunicella aestuarii]UAA38888.1 hypothetical protein KIH87_00475 [Paraneptunicella aestuarii]